MSGPTRKYILSVFNQAGLATLLKKSQVVRNIESLIVGHPAYKIVRKIGNREFFVRTACNCNGLSNRCYFDENLYRLTGHGGHCLECSKNRDGPNCERCKQHYFQPSGEEACFPCNCNETGKYFIFWVIIIMYFSWTITYEKANVILRFVELAV